MNNLHGGTPVVVCLYIKKPWVILSLSLYPARIICLKVPTNLSTCPLDEG